MAKRDPAKTLEERYERQCAAQTDIHEHLPTLRKLAEECQNVVEFGCRGACSTTALLMGCKGKVYSWDLTINGQITFLISLAEGRFIFQVGDCRKAVLPECDMLFIDSYHTKEHMAAELKAHGNTPRKYLVFHDTVTWGEQGEGGKPGIMHAITEWLHNGGQGWKIKTHYFNNNGLLVCERAEAQ